MTSRRTPPRLSVTSQIRGISSSSRSTGRTCWPWAGITRFKTSSRSGLSFVKSSLTMNNWPVIATQEALARAWSSERLGRT